MAASLAENVRIPPAMLAGSLEAPANARGVVVFAHGSGSSRTSPRNQQVAAALRARGFATLLFDLLTEREARSRVNVFDVGLLADRLVSTTEWLRCATSMRGKPHAFFGASTGAAAALVAASRRDHVWAVVARGGRPDLAGPALARVRAPTLLVVGSLDSEVLDLNRSALEQLGCEEKRLAVVEGATHLFAEPGTLERVCDLAGDWLERHWHGAAEDLDVRRSPRRG